MDREEGLGRGLHLCGREVVLIHAGCRHSGVATSRPSTPLPITPVLSKEVENARVPRVNVGGIIPSVCCWTFGRGVDTVPQGRAF